MGLKRIYLAGPEVFLPNPLEIAEQKKAICARFGFEGVFPLDAELDIVELPPRKAGYAIYQGNKRLMESCDLLIANMTPFRGPSMDVGTAFEMGFIRGLGRPVLGYTNVVTGSLERIKESLAERGIAHGLTVLGNAFVDPSGMSVENFDMVDNLMLESAVLESGGTIIRKAAPARQRYTNLDAFAECVKLAAELFGEGATKQRPTQALS